MQRTHRWALRSLAARTNAAQGLFAIVQGGIIPELRRESAAFLTEHPFDGFAIGGLAVGDTRSEREDVTALSAARRARTRRLSGAAATSTTVARRRGPNSPPAASAAGSRASRTSGAASVAASLGVPRVPVGADPHR